MSEPGSEGPRLWERQRRQADMVMLVLRRGAADRIRTLPEAPECAEAMELATPHWRSRSRELFDSIEYAFRLPTLS
jgi:hypothetical protein